MDGYARLPIRPSSLQAGIGAVWKDFELTPIQFLLRRATHLETLMVCGNAVANHAIATNL
jgi:hypothetical protein